MPELSTGELVLRLLLAAALGGAIGMERELRERGAGLRTHLLVAVGSALFTLVSAYGWRDFHFSNASGVGFDPTRIAAQIVTGVGFLGAGAIIRQGRAVRGLTTAATLWVVAAIGMAAGAGYYAAAVAATALVLVGLWPLRILVWRLSRHVRPEEERLVLDLRSGGNLARVVDTVEGAAGTVSSLQMSNESEGGGRSVELHVRFPHAGRVGVVEQLSQLDEVAGVRWNP